MTPVPVYIIFYHYTCIYIYSSLQLTSTLNGENLHHFLDVPRLETNLVILHILHSDFRFVLLCPLQWCYMGGVLKYGYHQKIHLFIIFHYKPSIWRTPIYGNPHITIKAHHDLNSVEPKRAVRRCFGPMALHQRHELGLSS